MANDIATRAVWNINCSPRAGGSKQLRRMVDASVEGGGSVEAVNEVGGAEPVGFTITPGPKTITLNFRERKGAKPEVDWDYLDVSKEVFSLTRQVVGGRRTQFAECMVSSKSDEDSDQGEITYTVEIVGLAGKPM